MGMLKSRTRSWVDNVNLPLMMAKWSFKQKAASTRQEMLKAKTGHSLRLYPFILVINHDIETYQQSFILSIVCNGHAPQTV